MQEGAFRLTAVPANDTEYNVPEGDAYVLKLSFAPVSDKPNVSYQGLLMSTSKSSPQGLAVLGTEDASKNAIMTCHVDGYELQCAPDYVSAISTGTLGNFSGYRVIRASRRWPSADSSN